MSSNPFAPAYGVQPPLLAGRDDLLGRALDGYRRGPGHPDFHLALYGPRGVGKTVLADAMAARVLGDGQVDDAGVILRH